MELRKYQNEAVAAIENEWAKGNRKTLLVMPTGSGKTQCFGKVVYDAVQDGSRALILAHRGELLEQAAERLKVSYGLDSGLEKAESSSLGSMFPVTVGSVQTLAQEDRLHRYPRDYFKTIVVDEAHHCMSESYQRVLSWFKDAYVLGVTATPDRADQKNLGQYFDSKAYEYTMRQAIREGYLCPVRAQMIPLELDISDVHINSGDFAPGELGTKLDPYLDRIADEMLSYCPDRKTVVFLPLVKTSQKFCNILNSKGFKAVEVNANTPDRGKILKAFEEGTYNLICNSMLLTEGWDCPAVDCIVMLRPTKIRSLFTQAIGRGMRLSPGKDGLLILDFLWLSQRLDLCRPASLIARNDDIAKRITETIKNSEGGIDLIEVEDRAEKDAVAEREEALAQKLQEMRTRQRKLVDPMQYMFSIEAEDLAEYEPTFPWEMGPASPKQLDYLEKKGINPDVVPNAGMAALLIDHLHDRMCEGLSTPKQIRLLERFGFRHVGTWKFDDAQTMIARMAAQNWRIPKGINPATYVPGKKGDE